MKKIVAIALAFSLNYLPSVSLAAGRLITIVNPFPSGGTTEILAHSIADGLAKELGQPVIVDTRAGAGGNIGLQFAAKADPDGHTLAMYPISSVIAPSVYKDLRFDPVNDFRGIAMVGDMPALLAVNPSVPVSSVQELIQYTKDHPGELMYASAGVGTSPHLYMELFKSMTGVKMEHVSYKGAGPSIIDLIGGHVHVAFQTATAVIGNVQKGQLRALGTSSSKPFAPLPDVKPISATVPGFDATTWFGIVAPASTPDDIVEKLNKAITNVLNSADVKKRWHELGVVFEPKTAAEFDAFIRSEHKRWAEVADNSGVRPQ